MYLPSQEPKKFGQTALFKIETTSKVGEHKGDTKKHGDLHP
jgi:hypothetical protein